MKTTKLKINPTPTYHSSSDKNSYITVTYLKNTGNSGGKFHPQDNGSTCLQEFMNNTFYFGTICYDIRKDMKLDYTISRFFHKISLSDLETLHPLCELKQRQILQSLALAVFKYLTQDIYYKTIEQI